MKKTTGKVVSLVLALALVVTSFSATFAFAATANVSGTTGVDKNVYLANGGVGDTLMTADIKAAVGAVTLTTKDHQTAVGSLTAIAYSSGSKILDLKTGTDLGKVKLTSTTASGKEVLTLLYTGTYADGEKDYTVKGTAKVTVTVYNKGDVLIGKLVDDAAMGDHIDAIDDLARNQIAGNVSTFAVVKVAAPVDPATSALATLSAATTVADTTDGIAAAAAGNFAITTDATSDVALTFTDAPSAALLKNQSGTKTVKVSAAEIISDGATPTPALSKSTTSKADAKLKIANKFVQPAGAQVKKLGGDTYFVDAAGAKVKVGTEAGDAWKITGAGIDLTGILTVDSGTVGAITGAYAVTVNEKANVASIDVDGNVNVVNGKVGTIKAVKDGETYTVEVKNGSAASVEASIVKVTGGAVKGEVKATSVEVNPSDSKTAASVGDVTAKDLKLDSSNAKATAGKYKANDADASVELIGENSIIGAIDFDYQASELKLTGFKGSVATIGNSKKTKINASGDSTNATVNGTVLVDVISATDGSVAFTGNVTTNSVEGPGDIVIAAGKLMVNDSVSGSPVLKLSDKTFAKNTAVFKAVSDTVSAEDFAPYGFKLDVVAGDKIDSFVIKSVEFAGIVLNKTSAKIPVGSQYKQTFTASAYPVGTTLPADTKIKWEFTGSNEYFTFTSTGNTATIETIGVDKDFASENKGTLKATLVDSDDWSLDYAAGTADIEAIAKPEYVSDTNNDFSVNAGKTYQFKITSDTKPVLTLGTSGVFTSVMATNVGNDYYIKITAVGKVGSATGVYINGNKLLVATVSAPAYTSDTKGNVTVKGAYTVKITSATVPTFGVGTAGVFSAKFVSKTGNDYLYKISSVGKVGTQAGIYINGVKTFVGIVG